MRSLPLVLAFASATAGAQVTYFVDANNGADTNTGRARNNAFRSLTYASGILADGDTLMVLPGTYAPSTTSEILPIVFGNRTQTQNRIRIIGERGPAVTTIDGENGSINNARPLVRFRWDSDGAELAGFTFANTSAADYWSKAIHCGSTSGGNFSCRNLDIHGNVFLNVHRAIVIFGTDPINANPTSGIRFHDNLIVNTTFPAIETWTEASSYIYNNTIVNSTTSGIGVDNVFSMNNPAVVANNVIVNGTGFGILAGAFGGSATYDNNDAFNNAAGNYSGATFNASNLSVDPLFVNASGGDYHLSAASPMIESGTLVLPAVRDDLDRFSRAHDVDGNGVAGIDRGCYQTTQHTMQMAGTWAQGSVALFNFQSPQPGIGLVLFSLGSASIYAPPLGALGLDPLRLVTALTLSANSPGTAGIPLPVDPNLDGLRFFMQGVFVGPTAVHLLNVEERAL